MCEKKKVVLVTGASSGIGLELARQFAMHGNDLVLVARRQNRLSALAKELNRDYGARCVEICTDLSDIDAAEKIYEFCHNRGIDVDILINNAGFGANDIFLNQSTEVLNKMLLVNIMSLTQLTRMFLPAMRERGSGGVLNVASTGAFQPGPYIAVYYASKAYVLSFTCALASEMHGTGVRISCLAPGPVDTEFRTIAGISPGGLLRKFGELSAEKVAECAYLGFEKGRTIIVPGIVNKLGVWGLRFVTRRAAARMAGSVNKKENEFT